jgi:repressor LexA
MIMLTQRQKSLVKFIDAYQQTHGGVSPRYREMADGVGLKSKGNIHKLLHNLQEMGVVRWMPNRHQAIEIMKPKPIRYAVYRFNDEAKELVLVT